MRKLDGKQKTEHRFNGKLRTKNQSTQSINTQKLNSNNNTLYIRCDQRALLYKSIRTERSNSTCTSMLITELLHYSQIYSLAEYLSNHLSIYAPNQPLVAHPVYASVRPNRSVQADPANVELVSQQALKRR